MVIDDTKIIEDTINKIKNTKEYLAERKDLLQ